MPIIATLIDLTQDLSAFGASETWIASAVAIGIAFMAIKLLRLIGWLLSLFGALATVALVLILARPLIAGTIKIDASARVAGSLCAGCSSR